MAGLRMMKSYLKARAWKQHLFTSLIICYLIISQASGQTSRRSSVIKGEPATVTGRVIEIDKTQVLIPDVKVITNQGKEARLYTDLIKDKVVLLSFFYTNCSYICPMQGDRLSKVQARLGDRLGKDVFLISISMDPARDSQEKLAAWGKSFKAGQGWTLVSSNASEMSRMIEVFTGNTPGPKDMHGSLVFIGNDRTGKWMTADGLWGAETLIKLLSRFTDDATSK